MQTWCVRLLRIIYMTTLRTTGDERQGSRWADALVLGSNPRILLAMDYPSCKYVHYF